MEAPPPYPGLKSPQQGEERNPLQPASDTDLRTCTHPHILLAVRSSSSTLLHYWSSQSSSSAVSEPLDRRVHITIPTSLNPSSMQLIHGFRDLGTFTLPITDSDTETAISQFFSTLIGDISHDVSSSSEIIARLSTTPPTHGGLSVQVFAIPVQSDTVDGLVSDREHKPVWKWSKPDSSYEPKAGFWEVGIDQAVEDGEWRAGKDLQLLVRGIPTEEVEALKSRRTTSLD
ncbi:hypothetical protein F4805DRAFT_284809 [Annulohypoxylon moriforme]|nr:hypothetical protein F4805DRAFT_284809 [Annulohypoxylon moriforme]